MLKGNEPKNKNWKGKKSNRNLRNESQKKPDLASVEQSPPTEQSPSSSVPSSSSSRSLPTPENSSVSFSAHRDNNEIKIFKEGKTSDERTMIALLQDRKRISEEVEQQSLILYRRNLSGITQSDFPLLQHELKTRREYSLIAPLKADVIKQIERLPKQRENLERCSYDRFPMKGLPDFSSRSEVSTLILDQPHKKTEQVDTLLNSMIVTWDGGQCEVKLSVFLPEKPSKKDFEALAEAEALYQKALKTFQKEIFQQLLKQNPSELDFKALVEHQEALKKFQQEILKLYTQVAELLKLTPEADDFTKIVFATFQKKPLFAAIGCDFHTVEVTSEKEVTLSFCQERFKRFLPVLIKQKPHGQNGQNKVWVFGHKKNLKKSSRSGSEFEIVEALTPLVPQLYQTLLYGTEAEPKLLEREDYLMPIYHDIVSKGGHVTTISSDYLEALIPALAKTLPALKNCVQDQFFDLVKKLELIIQSLKYYWEKGMPSDASSQPSEAEQKAVEELFEEVKPFLELFPELAETVKRTKEESEAGFLKLFEKLRNFLETVSSKIESGLAAIKKEKEEIGKKEVLEKEDYKRLLELSERSIPLNRLSEKAGNFKKQLKPILEKYLNKKGESLSAQCLANFEKYLAFLKKYKEDYAKLSEHIEGVEVEIANRAQMVFSLEDTLMLENLCRAQFDVIKTALNSELSASGFSFFIEALTQLESNCRKMIEAGLVKKEEFLRAIQTTKREWDFIRSEEQTSFSVFQGSAESHPASQVWKGAKSFSKTISLLLKYLVKHKESPESKEFVEGKAQLELCLAAWQSTTLYKKIYAVGISEREQKAVQESQQIPKPSFEIILSQHHERLKISRQKIGKYLKSVVEVEKIFEGCLRNIKNQKEKILMPVEMRGLKVHQANLQEILLPILIAFELTPNGNISDKEKRILISELTLWRKAKQSEAQEALLSKNNQPLVSSSASERKMAVESLRLQPCSLDSLKQLKNTLSVFSVCQKGYLDITQKAEAIIKSHGQRLSALGLTPEPELLSEVSEMVSNINQLVSTQIQEAQRLTAALASYESVELTHGLTHQEKTEVALRLSTLRLSYVKLQSKYHRLQYLNQQIELIVRQQAFCLEQIEQIKSGMGNPTLYGRLLEEQTELAKQLDNLRRSKRSMLERNGEREPAGTLAKLAFEIQSELDSLVGKKTLDELYFKLQKVPMVFKKLKSQRDSKVAAEARLIFKDVANRQLFQSSVQLLKVELIKMRNRVQFVHEELNESSLPDSSDNRWSPKNYLAGLQRYCQRLQSTLERFEGCKLKVDEAYFAKKEEPEKPVLRKPDASAMALASARDPAAREQALIAYRAALDARNIQESVEGSFFDAREEEMNFVIEAQKKHLTKRLEAIRLQEKTRYQAERERYTKPYAMALEWAYNRDLLSQFQLLCHRRNEYAAKKQKEDQDLTQAMVKQEL